MFDNLDLYHRYEREQEKQLERLPRCCSCGEHIQDDYLYEINGDLICAECLKDEYRKRTEDFIE